jgi:hypothetical protein
MLDEDAKGEFVFHWHFYIQCRPTTFRVHGVFCFGFNGKG